MDAHVRISNLNASYGDMPVLKNISLEIPRRQVTAIMGPSGCGKSTLLSTLNRFFELSENGRMSGKIEVDGQDIYAPDVDVTEVRKRIGLLAQKPFPLPMSIFDNVAYGIRLHRTRKDTQAERQAVQHYLELAGLWDEVKDRLHAPAARLSLGQQQRLCLARGLAIEPELILGDEPTSSLDPFAAQHIEQRLLALKLEYTVVIVTHTLRQARRLADYAVFMFLGEVIEAGPAAQIFSAPQQARTREYFEGVF